MITKSKSFIVKKANGVNDFQIQLRGMYGLIKSEKRLRAVLVSAINKSEPAALRACLEDKYKRGQLLEIMRFFGIVDQTKLIK